MLTVFVWNYYARATRLAADRHEFWRVAYVRHTIAFADAGRYVWLIGRWSSFTFIFHRVFWGDFWAFFGLAAVLNAYGR